MTFKPWTSYGVSPISWLRQRLNCLNGKHRGYNTFCGSYCTWCNKWFDYE